VGRTVLIADDSPTIQSKAKGILTGEGWEVVTVSNGVAAIKKLSAVKPLVILADVSMPGKDGYEVCEFVKNSPDLRHVPVVLVFSDMEPYDAERGARARADGTIRKKSGVRDPFDHEELISTVAKCVAQAEAAAAAPQAVPAPPPEPAIVIEPVDLEPEIAAREVAPEFAALSEGVAFVEPGLEEVPAPAPAPAPPTAEPMPEVEIAAEPEAPTEPGAVEAEAAPEAMPSMVGEAAVPVEPVLIEEEAPVGTGLPVPAAERTMAFRAPVEIAEPVLSDELAPAPPVAEAGPEAGEAEAAPEQAPLAAASLESFSLAEATAGQVRFAEPEGVELAPEAGVATMPSEALAEAVAAPTPVPTLDVSLAHAIIHKVVVKMAPAALSSEMIEEVARKIADEVIAELDSELSSPQ